MKLGLMGRHLARGLGAALGVAFASQAWGSGFALKEQGGAGLGNAFAGVTAAAEDLSTLFFNPAGLMRLSGNHAMGAVSLIVSFPGSPIPDRRIFWARGSPAAVAATQACRRAYRPSMACGTIRPI